MYGFQENFKIYMFCLTKMANKYVLKNEINIECVNFNEHKLNHKTIFKWTQFQKYGGWTQQLSKK